jgi:hypothetical protein
LFRLEEEEEGATREKGATMDQICHAAEGEAKVPTMLASL